MTEEIKRSTKSLWPNIRKWMNIKSGTDELYSDYNRSKGCTDAILYYKEGERVARTMVSTLLYPKNYQWLVESSDRIQRPGLNRIMTGDDDSRSLRMFVGTWNVGGKSPHNGLNLNEWLKTKDPADIYVLGFQEIVPLNAGNVLGPENSIPASKWLSLINKTLNENKSSKSKQYTNKYSLAASKQLVGIFLCLWVRQDFNDHITRLRVSCVGRGIMGYLGNKGAISISMTLHRTTFCFVCTHLASGEKESDVVRRNEDVMEILKRTTFYRDSPETILDHEKIIWLGDLNYRLSSIDSDTYELIEKRDWQALLDKDQLRIEQKARRVLEDWEEGEINFSPTYKYFPDSDHYVVHASSTPKEKRRTPAWCDRILWKGKGVKQMCYSRGESRFSDHRSVYSVFSVQVNSSRMPCTRSDTIANLLHQPIHISQAKKIVESNVCIVYSTCRACS